MMADDTLFPPIVLTGASGWIGTAMLAHLAHRLGEGWQERVRLFGSSARSLGGPTGDLSVRPLSEISGADVRDAIVVHLAYLTKEKSDQGSETAFALTNQAIDDCVLRAIAQAAPRAVFVASSGAATLAADGRDRHPYGLAKLDQERRFLEAAKAQGFPLLVGRIFNLAGPYINKVESYAIGAFATQALLGGMIRIDARVPVFRSFLHVDDLCAIVIGAGLARLDRARPIDLCGAEILEMGDLAARVAAAVGGEIPIVRQQVDVSRPSIYLGAATDTKVLAMSLDLPIRSFDQQVRDTISFVAKLHNVSRTMLVVPTVARMDPVGAIWPGGGADVPPSLPSSDDTINPSQRIDGNPIAEVRRK